MKFNKNDWHYFGQWAQPTISETTWDNWSNNSSYPFVIPHIGGKFLSFDGHSFVEKKDFETLKHFILSKQHDPLFLKQVEQWVDTVHAQACALVVREDDLHGTLREFKQMYDEVVNPWIFLLLVGDILDEEIKRVCIKNGHDFEMIASAVAPSRKSFIAQQIEEANLLHKKLENLGVAKKFSVLEQHQDVANEIKTHVERFAFCGMHHFVGEPYTLAKFFAHTPKGNQTDGNQIIIPQELKCYVDFISLAAFARTHMAETSDYLQHKITPLLKKVNVQLGLAENDYLHMSITELIAALKELSVFVRPAIEERKKSAGAYPFEGKQVIIHGHEVKQHIDQLVPKHDTTFPLKGMVACKGIVQGVVRIVVHPEDIHHFIKGEILVTPETTPDFFPAMKIASAVITDRGGITSHAAIVSRELGVPCIVGTKCATTALKDGDLVEIDAMDGEVRKIN
jgi:phosphohistidine swiveling domain-containing protein